MKSRHLKRTMFREFFHLFTLAATAFSSTALAQANGRYEHMEYGISTPQRLSAAREALRDDTFPELNDSVNTENFIAIDMACGKYPNGPVRQTCLDAGKVRYRDGYKRTTAGKPADAQRSIAEQAREVQAATAAQEAMVADKEARQERVRAATATLSGWDEHDAYKRCMQESNHDEAPNPAQRVDVRDRRASRIEASIPPPDIAEACVADAKRLVTEERKRNAAAAAEAKAIASERQRARETCRNSEAARLAEESRFLVMNRELLKIAIADAREKLERDKEIERVTGVADLKLRHDAGDTIVNGPAQLATQFEAYRSLGGTARSIEDVEGLPDPCQGLP